MPLFRKLSEASFQSRKTLHMDGGRIFGEPWSDWGDPDKHKQTNGLRRSPEERSFPVDNQSKNFGTGCAFTQASRQT
jgi:hypothetical protein